MATSVNNTNTYAGKNAGEYIKKAFQANESMAGVTLKTNIDHKQVVRKLIDNVTFGTETCDFTPTGTVTLTERVLTLQKFEVARQFCLSDFLADWEAAYAEDGTLSPELIETIQLNMLEGIAAHNEYCMWQGVVDSPQTQYDGFETLFLADATVLDVTTPTPAAITTSNIISILEATVALMPTAVKRSTEKPKLFLSNKAFEAYVNKQASLGNGNLYNSGAAISLTFNGMYDIVVAPGMSDDCIVFAQKSNLWFGTNVMNQWNEIAIKNMYEVDLSDNIRFKARFFAGVQYGIGSEIVMYRYEA